MSVEAIQCPKCGGPLTVEEGRDSVYCSHCGAGLRIAKGSSGHPMATLADIKDDTSLLAIRAALERLEEKLQGCRGELQGLENARSELLEAWEAEQQRVEQRQEDRNTRLPMLRKHLRDSTMAMTILMFLGVLSLGLSLCVIPATGELGDGAGGLVLGLAFLIPAFFILFRERPKYVKQIEYLEKDLGAPGAERRADRHKENLRQIVVQMNDIQTQIHRMERQRLTLHGKLDRLTDQL